MNFDPPDTVLLYGPVWDAPSRMSKHHLAIQWSQTRRVLYIEAPPNPLSWLTRREETRRLWKRFRQGPVQVSRNLWVQSYCYLLPYRGRMWQFGGRGVNRLNQWWVRRWFRQTLASLEFDDPLYVVGHAGALDLLNGLSRRALLYHCSDDFTLVPSFPESFGSLERELMKEADGVVTTAEALTSAKRPFCRRIWTIPNGADVDHFSRVRDHDLQVAPDLERLESPRIGYVGTVFRWIDQEWVFWTAKQEPEWNFVFVGPIETDVSRLRDLRNVHFFGPRDYQSLPEYLKGFDVATVPFRIDDLTLRASPIKFYEYLASGLPVVATRLPDLEPYRDVCWLVDNPQGFHEAVRQALREKERRSSDWRAWRAQTHSWIQRAEQFDGVIENIMAAGSTQTAGHQIVCRS